MIFKSPNTFLTDIARKKTMLIHINCAKCIGIEALPVKVEVDISPGIGIHLVGMADLAVKESLLRTVTALQSVGFRIPGRKIVISLAPADIRKSGSGYDLPIAIGIIAASGQCSLPLISSYLIMGELGLDASVRPLSGALPIAEYAAKDGLAGCILPYSSALEAAELKGTKIYGVRSLEEVIWILQEDRRAAGLIIATSHDKEDGRQEGEYMDFADILGQEGAKRGAEIAAAGGHNLIMIGPPGSGKTSIARAIVGILPPMEQDEAILTSKIYSVAGLHNGACGLVRQRPFRSPHYSVSMAAMIGGGNADNILPGEISLAQNGVLFIDEFGQMSRQITEALRGPLEDRKVIISRLRTKVEYPASFMLIAATNPCPCGYYGEKGRCTCSPYKRADYLSRLSGPIMDRIDIQINIRPVSPASLVSKTRGECSRDIRSRITAARKIQRMRFKEEGIYLNAEMQGRQIEKYCLTNSNVTGILEAIASKYGLSARGFTRVLKVARTIADLESSCGPSKEGSDPSEAAVGMPIREDHLLEALSYRFLDRVLS